MTRQTKRRRLTHWLREFLNIEVKTKPNRSIRVESLEARQLLAADGMRSLLASYVDESAPEAANLVSVVDTSSAAEQITGNADSTPTVGSNSVSAVSGEGEDGAEGEDAPDLVAFARALDESGTRFFGASWCPACEAQKALFEDGYKFLPFIEVTNNSRELNSIGIAENLEGEELPTWEFPDGDRRTGILSLQELSQESGVAIPQSSIPSVAPLADVSVAQNSPLHIPIDAYDPNGNPLTITVTSSNSNVSAEVLTGNRSLVINTEGFGDMVFELFEQRAPRPSGRVIELAEAGFYDGLIWHRVVNNFVIQGGDPNGNGRGGSTLGDFDDQFDLELQHNRPGILSYAKSTDDTNDSQFFVTEVATRSLDFNHSIFGVLVEGEDVRQAISDVRVETVNGQEDVPTPFTITMESVDVFNDTENAVVMLTANGVSGSSEITVRIEDTEGNVTEETFTANAVADSSSVNTAPFLEDIGIVETEGGVPVTFNLPGVDRENNNLIFSVSNPSQAGFGLNVDSSTGAVTVTPPLGFVGDFTFRANVRQNVPVTTFSSPDDNQTVTVRVTPSSVPTSLDLDAASDSGENDNDNITNASSLSFTVNGTIAGANVEVLSGGNVVGSATASGTATTVQVANTNGLGEGSVAFTARQTVDGTTSGESPVLSVVLDQTGPVEVAPSLVPVSLIINNALNVDLQHPEEGLGLEYSLANEPTGMTISATGVLNWTPAQAQIGAQTFQLILTDRAGNISNQSFTINVIEEPLMRVSLVALDDSGAPLDSVSAGDEFRVQVRVQDLRNFTEADGVFAAHYDILFDSSIVAPVGNSPITYLDPYTGQQIGSIGDGIIDEAGSFSERSSVLGNDERAHIEIRFEALQSGNPNIRLDPPDNPLNENLLYTLNEVVPNSRVEFGSLDLQVGLDFELVNDSFNFDEDSGEQTLAVLDNDTGTGAASLTIAELGTPTGGGSVQISNDGRSILYTSAANFNGGETFTYTARNTSGVEQTATVTVQVTDVNDPPVALNDTFTVEDGSNNNVLEVLDNDSFGVDSGAGETLRISSVSSGSNNGAIVVSNGGLSINYSPATGFTGSETFTYTLSDGRGGEATGTVTVNVDVANPPPNVQNDSFTVEEDAAQATFDVLQNDTTNDPTETLSVSEVRASQFGSLFQVSSDGQSVIYQPAADFSGVEILSYTVRDSGGAEANGAVTFTVNAVNDPPIAVDDSATVISANDTTTIEVLVNDSTPDEGETLTITEVTQPSSGNGTVEIASDGLSLIYRPPNSEFDGTVDFTYTISDGNGLTATADVTLQVEDFLPRDITGRVSYASADSNVISQVPLRLSGTAITGDSVSLSTNAGADGRYSFSELAPGDYQLVREPLPFLDDPGETVQINSGVADGNFEADLVVEGNLKPQHFDIRDFLGSTFANSLLVAVDNDGSAAWTAGVGEWNTLSDLDVNVQSEELVVNATSSSNAALSGNLDLASSTSRVHESGREGDFRLFRVRGTPSTVGLSEDAGSGAPGEGEPAVEGESIAALDDQLVGEGEASAAVSIPLIQSANGSAIDSSPTRTRRLRLASQNSIVDQAIAEEF